jgi:hypothetical protein
MCYTGVVFDPIASIKLLVHSYPLPGLPLNFSFTSQVSVSANGIQQYKLPHNPHISLTR